MTSEQNTGATLRSLYAADGGARSVFTGKTADYAASRPDYPAALFDMLGKVCAPVEGVTVADVGAGTGLLTRGLLKYGYRVVAVEPNLEMRRMADSNLGEYPGYRSVEGCAEAMPLEAASIHLITAAQAFHWFEVERARNEFLRVLSAQGQVALIWNDRILDDPLQVALDEMFSEFGGAKRGALLAHEDRSVVPRFFGSTRPKEFSWPHAHCLNEAGLMSLVFSRSYMPGRNSRDGPAVAGRVREVFSRFAADGSVKVGYRTVAIVGRPT
jgi:ubiquinone/menaquinone biosynthesis C-methylase UbiE